MECDELSLAPNQSVCQDALSDDNTNCLLNQKSKIEESLNNYKGIIDECRNDLESIIDKYLNSPNETPSDPYAASVLDLLGEYLIERYKSTMEILYLEKSIKLAREAIKATPIHDEHWLERMHALGYRVCEKFKYSDALADLEEMICLLQRVFDVVSSQSPAYTATTRMIGTLLNLKFFQSEDVADLDKAVSVMQGVIDVTPPDHPDRTELLSTLQTSLIHRHRCTGEIADNDEAICLGQDLINAMPLNHPERAIRLSSLAQGFYNRYSVTKDIRDLNEAISLSQEANDTVPRTGQSSVASLHALLLCTKYDCYGEIVGEIADLEEAIYVSFKAIDTCPANKPQWNPLLKSLRLLFKIRHSFTGALADIDAAVTILQTIIATMPSHDPERDRVIDSLGEHLLDRYRHTGATADLDEAIHVYREALNVVSLDFKSRLRLSKGLSSCLKEKYSHTGARSDIEESICLLREAVRSTHMDDSERADVLSSLAQCLARKYDRTGSLKDIDEVIHINRNLLENISLAGEARIATLFSLSGYLELRYSRIGAMADVEEAILILREAVGLMPPGYKKRAEILACLAVRLLTKYRQTKGIEYLNEAIHLSQESLEARPHNRRTQLHALSVILEERFEHSGDIADLEEAILILREGIKTTSPDEAICVAHFGGLASLLEKRFNLIGANTDLDEAIRLAQEAVDTLPPGHPTRAILLADLGSYLDRRSSRTQREAGLKGVMDWCSTHPNEPIMPELKAHLIEMQELMKPLDGTENFLENENLAEAEPKILADVKNARECFVEALYNESAEFKVRFSAGRNALSSYDFENYKQAYDVAKYTIDLIPLLASRSLRNSDKQRILSDVVGVSSTAAAIALYALPANQRPFAAIECLETGRGLIGRALLEQHDVSNLEKYYPDLAVSFLNLRDRLDRPDIPDMLNATTVSVEAEENARHRAEKEFTTLLERIRSKTAFERFLLPASEVDMVKEAACGGPIVIINTSRRPRRCDALIISQSGLRVLELSEFSEETWSEWVFPERLNNVESLETLAWLWDVIVCPVLDVLGFTETPSGDSWPHMWWILTGKLTSKLPLHAAGHHLRRSGETTLDRVVSSYATSVKSIIHTRQRGEQILLEPLNVVAVAMEQTDGQADLIHAAREIDAISNLLESKAISYEQPPPYKADVLSAMKTCQIFHFAGHGESHPIDPLKSALLLRDWQNEPLTVESLLETEISSNQPFLAYLSACGTGQIINDESLDESIHLANTFQLAGFRHVIGTLWSVDDEICVDIAEMLYKALRDRMHDQSVSRGLHDAVRTLRNRWVDGADGGDGNETMAVDGMREGRHAQLDDDGQLGRPLWIPYVHFGA